MRKGDEMPFADRAIVAEDGEKDGAKAKKKKKNKKKLRKKKEASEGMLISEEVRLAYCYTPGDSKHDSPKTDASPDEQNFRKVLTKKQVKERKKKHVDGLPTEAEQAEEINPDEHDQPAPFTAGCATTDISSTVQKHSLVHDDKESQHAEAQHAAHAEKGKRLVDGISADKAHSAASPSAATWADVLKHKGEAAHGHRPLTDASAEAAEVLLVGLTTTPSLNRAAPARARTANDALAASRNPPPKRYKVLKYAGAPAQKGSVCDKAQPGSAPPDHSVRHSESLSGAARPPSLSPAKQDDVADDHRSAASTKEEVDHTTARCDAKFCGGPKNASSLSDTAEGAAQSWIDLDATLAADPLFFDAAHCQCCAGNATVDSVAANSSRGFRRLPALAALSDLDRVRDEAAAVATEPVAVRSPHEDVAEQADLSKPLVVQLYALSFPSRENLESQTSSPEKVAPETCTSLSGFARHQLIAESVVGLFVEPQRNGAVVSFDSLSLSSFWTAGQTLPIPEQAAPALIFQEWTEANKAEWKIPAAQQSSFCQRLLSNAEASAKHTLNVDMLGALRRWQEMLASGRCDFPMSILENTPTASGYCFNGKYILGFPLYLVHTLGASKRLAKAEELVAELKALQLEGHVTVRGSLCYSLSEQFIIGKSSKNSSTVYLGLLGDCPVAVKRLERKDCCWPLPEPVINMLVNAKAAGYHMNRYLAAIAEDDAVYIAQELCSCNLDELLQTLREQNRYIMDIGHYLSWQLLAGLNCLHDCCVGLPHRNLKPTNVLIDAAGRLKLSDYGLLPTAEPPGDAGEVLTTYTDNSVGSNTWRPKECSSHGQAWAKNPPFSVHYTLQSDIQVAGMLIHYILTGGKHPYGDNTFDIEMNIARGWPKWQKINDEANDCIRCMLANNANERPSVRQLLNHPLFWTEREKHSFLLAVGKEVMRECHYAPASSSVTCDRLNSAGFQAVNRDWMSQVYPMLLHYLRTYREYKNTVTDLLRFMFNSTLYYASMPADCRRILGEDHLYFIRTFPNLLMSVYRIIKTSDWKDRSSITRFVPDC